MNGNTKPEAQAAGVVDVLWRIENEAGQFIDEKGMVYLRYLGDLLKSAPASPAAQTVRIDLSVFDQKGDPRDNLIARGWTPPASPAAQQTDPVQSAIAEAERDGRDPYLAGIMARSETQQPAADAVESVIETLLQIAYRAWCLADDTEDGPHGLIVDRADFDALSDELDKLDALPDDQPGYTMEAAAKARWALRGLFAAMTSAQQPAVVGDGRLSPQVIESGWRDTFSTTNPFCPCDLRIFTKAVRWAERALTPAATPYAPSECIDRCGSGEPCDTTRCPLPAAATPGSQKGEG